MTLETPRTALRTEHCPCSYEYGRMCHTAPAAQKYGFSWEPMLHLAFLVRPESSKSMPATKHGQQRKNRKNHPGGPKKGSKNNLMRGTAKWHGFLHIGSHLVTKGVLGHMRQITPFPHAQRENRPIFSKYGFSPQVGLGVDGPCNTAGHLQSTPGTPAMHFPLLASGSQSAL